MKLRRLPARAGLLLRRGFDSLLRAAGTRDAAQVAFFLVLSFPALLLLLVWGFSTVLSDDSVRQRIVDAIVDVLPVSDAGGRRQVETLLDEIAAGAGSLGWIGAVSLLYSASGAIGALRHAVNEAWGQRDTRPFVPGKALDVGLTLVAAPTVIVALGLSLSGTLSRKIGDHPFLRAAAEFAVTDLLPLAMVFCLFVGLLYVLPASRRRLGAAWPGALVAMLGVLAVRFGTDVYFALFGDSNAVYGTLGVLLAIVFSAYLAAIAVVFGAHVAAQASRFESGAAIDRAIEEEAGGPPLGRFVLDALRGLFVREPR